MYLVTFCYCKLANLILLVVNIQCFCLSVSPDGLSQMLPLSISGTTTHGWKQSSGVKGHSGEKRVLPLVYCSERELWMPDIGADLGEERVSCPFTQRTMRSDHLKCLLVHWTVTLDCYKNETQVHLDDYCHARSSSVSPWFAAATQKWNLHLWQRGSTRSKWRSETLCACLSLSENWAATSSLCTSWKGKSKPVIVSSCCVSSENTFSSEVKKAWEFKIHK